MTEEGQRYTVRGRERKIETESREKYQEGGSEKGVRGKRETETEGDRDR